MDVMDAALKSALTSHLSDDIIPLKITIPLTRQINKEFCKQITKELSDALGKWEFKRATKTLGNHLPDLPGIYMFCFSSSFKLEFDSRECFNPISVLYVGKAGGNSNNGTLKSRYNSEYKNYVGESPNNLWRKGADKTNRKDLLERALCIHPLELWFATASRVSALDKLEKDLIHLLNPPLNTQLQPKLRMLAPEKAF